MQMISLMDSLLKRVNLDLRCAAVLLRCLGSGCMRLQPSLKYQYSGQ